MNTTTPYQYQKKYKKRQDLLKHLLITLPEAATKRRITVSELSIRMGISRNSISRLLNTDPDRMPLSEQMAVRCFLLTRTLPLNSQPLNLEDWLNIDTYYREEETNRRIHTLLDELSEGVRPFEITQEKGDQKV